MSYALNCPKCGCNTNKLVIPPEGHLSCRDCAGPYKKAYNVNLGQTVTRFEDGHRLTVGKSWEIDHRIKSPDDNKTIINRVTGKPAQY